MKERVNKIYNNLEDEVDIILLANDIDPFLDHAFFYVTGYETGLFESSVAILYPDGKCDVLVSQLEETSARKGSDPINVFGSKEEYNALLKRKLKGYKRIGINSKELVYNRFNLIKRFTSKSSFIDCSKAINKARAIKDRKEIENIKHACDISSKAAEVIPDILDEGIKEYEAAAELEYKMKKLGADNLAFDTISAFGKNSAEPHYTAGGEKLKKNVFALFDYGASYRRYVSDITRTFFYGRAGKDDREMYDTVLNAQRLGMDTIEVGMKMKEPHLAVAEYIDKTRFKGKFIHGLGHGIGLSVHESFIGFLPSLEDPIEPGMVITVEPGIYIPGHGGVRIEDDVLIKKDGIEVLTSASRDFIEI